MTPHDSTSLASARVARACEAAAQALQGRRFSPESWHEAPSEVVAVGDPQTTPEQFFAVLDHNGLLRDDGLLRDGVTLISMGDHFDFGRGDPEQVGRAGMTILSWLAAHPPIRLRILFGNHDAARVMELVDVEDDVFEQARRLGMDVDQAADAAGRNALTERFHARYPQIPTPEVARRDFSGYSTVQRALVADLLMEGRFLLATTARDQGGHEVLLTHAAITRREVELLGLSTRPTAGALAAALNAVLHQAVDAVRERWLVQRWPPLDLSPLHQAGRTREESGGLLAHRPAAPAHGGENPPREFSRARPRRFHPADLPPRLRQACGHTRHAKLLKELSPWLGPGVTEAHAGSLRSLCVLGDDVAYLPGLVAKSPAHAVLYLIDVDMDRQPANACQVLRLRP